MLSAGYFNAKVRVYFKHEKNTDENFNFHYLFGFPIVKVCDTMQNVRYDKTCDVLSLKLVELRGNNV